MPSSPTFSLTYHGGEQGAPKRTWKRRRLVVSHVRCQILVDRGDAFCVVLLVVVAELWQQRCFWHVWLRTEIHSGSRSAVFSKTASFYGTRVRDPSPIFYSQVAVIIQAKLYKHLSLLCFRRPCRTKNPSSGRGLLRWSW